MVNKAILKKTNAGYIINIRYSTGLEETFNISLINKLKDLVVIDNKYITDSEENFKLMLEDNIDISNLFKFFSTKEIRQAIYKYKCKEYQESKPYNNKELLYKELIENGKSCYKLGAELGVSEYTIRKYAKKHGIDTSRNHLKTAKSEDKYIHQKNYHNKIKAMNKTKVVSNIFDVTFTEFQRQRDLLGLSNDEFLALLLNK